MATRTPRAKTGAFLVLSAAIIAAGLYLFFPYGKRAELHYYVLLRESAPGVNTGSPVFCMSVPVGSVGDIEVKTAKDEGPGEETYLARAEVRITRDGFVLREGMNAELSIYNVAGGTMAISFEGGRPDAPPLPEYSEIAASLITNQSLITSH